MNEDKSGCERRAVPRGSKKTYRSHNHNETNQTIAAVTTTAFAAAVVDIVVVVAVVGRW